VSGFPGADFEAGGVEEALVVVEADLCRGFRVERVPQGCVHFEDL